MNSLFKKYLDSNISVIGTRPLAGKPQFMSKMIVYILNNTDKNILLLGFDGPREWYLKYLLNSITKIDMEILRKYLYPCNYHSKNNEKIINRDKFIDGIEYLQKSNLIIKDYNWINPSGINKTGDFDIVYNMIDDSFEKMDVIIIDRIENLLKGSDITLEEALKKLRNLSKKMNLNIILFTNLSHNFEKNNKIELNSFDDYEIIDKYSDAISILFKENIELIKK